MSDGFETLEGLLSQAWRCLARGVTDRDAPARQPTLSTISPDGWPEVRTVVLRRFVPEQSLLEVYTDIHSAKIASLRATPRAALHVWDPAPNLQLRLRADVTLTTGAAVADRWEALPAAQRDSYGITPAPGTPIAAALDYVISPQQSHFCLLSLRLNHIDIVHLGTVHRRASFTGADAWHGQWVAP